MSLTGQETCEHLQLTLQCIKENSLPFGGATVMLIGDFLIGDANWRTSTSKANISFCE